MASEASGVATVTESTDSPATARGGRGGGRGRGRGGRGRGRGDSFQGDNGGYDNRQAHHRGRGRGQSNPAQVARPSNIGGNGAGGETPDGKGKENMAGKTIAEGANETEAEVCFICASPILHEAIYPCNHRTCHICSLRMRALYKDKNCAHCRVCG
jgi:hypothetical protein